MALDFKGKAVLITGGTGSFGQKFVAELLENDPPSRLIVFSRDELKQSEMQRKFDHPCLRFFIGDVRDRERLYRAMKGVDLVIHAAALKQVPACEYNPFEAVKTNILGSVNVIDAAIDNGVDRVLAVSTDKAVNPANLYGATKLCAEKLFVKSNSYSGAEGTKFSCSRYGNVVGSRGSVIPFFQEQKATGVITVTDERMTRFWITLEQGVAFVKRCLEAMHGGEIFVPKIPSMNIMDLVEAIAPGCEVKITGVRPGEKIHEVLISEDDEANQTLDLDGMYVVQPHNSWWAKDNWNEGKPVPEGFRYGSDTNEQKLSVSDLREIVASL
jgi:UDP-N-acetylglucosamine 4,6-dehydratase